MLQRGQLTTAKYSLERCLRACVQRLLFEGGTCKPPKTRSRRANSIQTSESLTSDMSTETPFRQNERNIQADNASTVSCQQRALGRVGREERSPDDDNLIVRAHGGE